MISKSSFESIERGRKIVKVIRSTRFKKELARDLGLNLLSVLFKKYFVVNERSTVKNSFSKKVWNNVDSHFCEALYVFQSYYQNSEAFDMMFYQEKPFEI